MQSLYNPNEQYTSGHSTSSFFRDSIVDVESLRFMINAITTGFNDDDDNPPKNDCDVLAI
ncbi:MAG: hypothetical protein IPP69_05080 [Flavobacteriales bacterium]|nr:hypothetical protein [Flavobacteriales bacterium]